MARKKVSLEYIKNDTARRVTYNKRVKGIVKKTQELSVLCDVDACTVIYGPYDKAPVVWPPVEGEARRILTDFIQKSEIDQTQRTFDQHTFLKQSVEKAEEKLKKLQRKNREMAMENLMADLLNGKPVEEVAINDLNDLLWVVEDKIRCVQHRLRVLEGDKNKIPNPVSVSGTNPPNHHPVNEMMMRGTSNMEAGPSHPPMCDGKEINRG